jgi:hypothetical protein
MASPQSMKPPYSQGFAIVGASSEQHHWNQYQHKEQHPEVKRTRTRTANKSENKNLELCLSTAVRCIRFREIPMMDVDGATLSSGEQRWSLCVRGCVSSPIRHHPSDEWVYLQDKEREAGAVYVLPCALLSS